jgi:hypothetical protein
MWPLLSGECTDRVRGGGSEVAHTPDACAHRRQLVAHHLNDLTRLVDWTSGPGYAPFYLPAPGESRPQWPRGERRTYAR